MGTVAHGSVDYVILEMKRAVLFEQAVNETRDLSVIQPKQVDKNRCGRCMIQYYYDSSSSSNVCPQCGVTVFVLENGHQTYNARSRYNRAPKHYYATHEHFFQTLLDVTCTSKRRLPIEVLRYCRCVLGRNPSITYEDTFEALQAGGYKQYYMLKYEIAAQLRGRPEIVLSIRETEQVRGHYRRYDRCFNDFQRHHKIGTRTISNRTRLYWPVRFIMAEIFKLIGRMDLLPYLRVIAGPKRMLLYVLYWDKLTVWVNRRTPLPERPSYRPTLTRIPIRPKRVRYSRPPA